jgi:hypothetical protein
MVGLLAATDASPAPAADAAPAPAAPASAAATQPPAGPPPASPPASIDQLLQPQGQAADEDDQPATAPAPLQGPGGLVPYAEMDSKAYGDAILAAARTAQAMQGPLDGGWGLAGPDGQRIYSFRLIDHGQGMSLAEGAWRDLSLKGASGSGVIASIGYDGDRLMLRFYESGPDDPVVITLRPSGGRDWPGELRRHGAVSKVTFSRE